MRGLELNKIAAAIFLAGLIAMISGAVTRGLYHGDESGHHAEGEAKRGYTIPGAEQFAQGAGGAAPAAEEAPVDIAVFLASADAMRGEAVSKRCLSCHTFEKGGADKVGPNLWGIVGASQAHKAGYAYSEAMAAGKGQRWDYQRLSEFLAAPQRYIKGTKMNYAGIRKPEERADLLMWLRQQGDSPLPIPAAKAQPEKVAPENPAGGAAPMLPPKKGPVPDAAGKAPEAAVTTTASQPATSTAGAVSATTGPKVGGVKTDKPDTTQPQAVAPKADPGTPPTLPPKAAQ